MLLTDRQKKIRNSLISEAIKGNFENIKNNHDSDIQEVLKSKLPSNIQEEFKGDLPNPCTTSQFIIFQKNQKEINQCIQKMEQKIESILCDIAIQEAKGSDDPNVKKIQDLLCCAVQQRNLQKVHNILNSNSNSDIQKILKSKFSDNYTILDFAILKQEGDIIKALWQRADKKTRILFSDSAIKLANYSSDFDVKEFIPEIQNYTKQKSIEENLEIATEKPTTKSVLQDVQLSQINRTCCIL